MVIIFNFCSLAASITCLITGFRLRRSYHQKRIEAIKGYSNSFFSVSLAYFILSLPGIILFDPFWVQIDFILADIFLLAAILFSEPSLISLSEKLRPFKKSVFFLILFWILLYTFLNIIFFSSAVSLMENNVVYYWRAGVPWLQNITRGLLVMAVISMTILFFRWAIISIEKNIIYRSVILGLSTLLLAVGGSMFWFFPFFHFSSNLLICSGVLGFLGYIGAIISTLVFRFPQETSVKKNI